MCIHVSLSRARLAHGIIDCMLPRLPRLDPRWRNARLAFGPSDGEVRSMLAQLQRRLGHVRAATLLGLPGRTWRAWVRGIRAPDGPARKLIWTYYCLVFRPELLRTLHSIATWGRFELVKRERPADDYQI
jgi:hypothetical protein